MKIVDGNKACSDIAYLFSEICAIYPITPSSPMASNIDALTTTDKLNLFNTKPRVIEMESESGAAGALHGALLTGSLGTTFTASQGLLLMIPNMYKMAGEMLPAVFHVAARSLATHSLSIFGDHQDIYAVRQTGFCMLASTNVYDAQNLAAVAHLSAVEGSLPFVHFFDGFRTSHELNTIKELPEVEVLQLINHKKIKEFKDRMLFPGAKKQFGMAQNEDIYFQGLESRNLDYDKMPDIVNEYMQKINNIMGTNYKPFNYYGDENAENIIVAMGSVCDTIKITIDRLNQGNKKYGLIEVHLYRPFSVKYLLDVMPKSVKNIAVLDRTKESGSIGEPLYLDIVAALNDKDIKIVGGRYGLSSKEVTPNDIAAVYNMLENDHKARFTLGIEDDVTNLSLEPIDIKIEEQAHAIKVYGFGSDGMVSASKDLMKLINKKMNMFVQGYFEYDSKKSGGVTVSNLRYSDLPINEPFYVKSSEITVVTKLNYFDKYEMIDSLKNKGILLINTNKKDDELINSIPNTEIDKLIEKKISVKYIDADKIAEDNNIKGKISKIMEAAILHLLGLNDSLDQLKENVRIQFKTKGENVVNSNINAID